MFLISSLSLDFSLQLSHRRGHKPKCEAFLGRVTEGGQKKRKEENKESMIAVTILQRFGKLNIKNCNLQSGQKLAACLAAFERIGMDSTHPRLPSVRLSPGAVHVRVCAHFADLKLESTSNASKALQPAYDAKINLSQPSTHPGATHHLPSGPSPCMSLYRGR